MRTMRIVALAAALVVAAPPAGALADGVKPGGAPEPVDGTLMAFSQLLKRCDFSETDYNGPSGYARPVGTLRTSGSAVTADVRIDTAVPNTHYDLRLIQVPRPSSAGCWGNDPGVAQTSLNTDAVGYAAVTVQDQIEPGATGAWLFISRPGQFTQVPAEFYTTDFVAPI